MGRNENIAMLHDTKKILDDHGYTKDGRWVELKLSSEEMTQVQVFLPDEVSDLTWEKIPVDHRTGHCRYSCENMDSYALARKRLSEGAEDVLVLNLANPVHPGGGVYRGRRFLSEEWVKNAGSCHVASSHINPAGNAIDEYAGYGFYFWRNNGAENSFRCYGREGQLVIILPEKNAVIAVQAMNSDVQPLVDTVWEEILPQL
jgi:hypothetical protein